MGEWQPIETAPRDGSDVLLFRDRHPPVVAGWFDNREEAGWATYDNPEEWLHEGRNPFTHWMPLPAPPAPSKPEEVG